MRAAVVWLAFSIALVGCGSAALSPVVDDQPSAAPGQTRLEFTVVPVDGQPPSATDLDTIRDIVAQRVVGVGATDPVVTLDDDRVIIDVSDPTDVDVVRGLVSATGRIDFVPLGTESVADGALIDRAAHPPLFSGDQIESAAIDSDQNGHPTVDFTLREAGRSKFAAYTAAHVGDYFAITLDDHVISAPVINGAILDGMVQISGAGIDGFSAADVSRLVSILRAGSLPFPIREVAPTPVP